MTFLEGVALFSAAMGGVVIVVLHIVLWPLQLGDRYGRPVPYAIGVSVIYLAFAGWAVAAGDWAALIVLGLVVGCVGTGNIACYAWHWWAARHGRGRVRKLARARRLPVREGRNER